VKKTAYKILMWWCIALAVVGVVIFAMGNTWGILQIVISAVIAYSAYRKVKDIDRQLNEKNSDVSYIFPDKVDLGNKEYLEEVKISDEFRNAIGLKGPIYTRKRRKREKEEEVKKGLVYGGKADGNYIPGENYYIVGGNKYKYSRDDLTEDEKISEMAGTVTRIIFEEEGLALDNDGNPIYRDGRHENERMADQ